MVGDTLESLRRCQKAFYLLNVLDGDFIKRRTQKCNLQGQLSTLTELAFCMFNDAEGVEV